MALSSVGWVPVVNMYYMLTWVALLRKKKQLNFFWAVLFKKKNFFWAVHSNPLLILFKDGLESGKDCNRASFNR